MQHSNSGSITCGCCQIICSEDGVFGAAMEHSNADGPTGAYSCVFIDAWKM